MHLREASCSCIRSSHARLVMAMKIISSPIIADVRVHYQVLNLGWMAEEPISESLATRLASKRPQVTTRRTSWTRMTMTWALLITWSAVTTKTMSKRKLITAKTSAMTKHWPSMMVKVLVTIRGRVITVRWPRKDLKRKIDSLQRRAECRKTPQRSLSASWASWFWRNKKRWTLYRSNKGKQMTKWANID